MAKTRSYGALLPSSGAGRPPACESDGRGFSPRRAWLILALLAPFGLGCGPSTSPNADAVLEGPAGEPSPYEDVYEDEG